MKMDWKAKEIAKTLAKGTMADSKQQKLVEDKFEELLIGYGKAVAERQRQECEKAYLLYCAFPSVEKDVADDIKNAPEPEF